MIFSFDLHSSLSRVEEGWLKLLPKRKLRESKTGDKEKEFLEKSVPRSTRYVSSYKSICSRTNFTYSTPQNPCHKLCNFVPLSTQSIFSQIPPVIKLKNFWKNLNLTPSQD